MPSIVKGITWGNEKVIVRFVGKQGDRTFDLPSKTKKDFNNIFTVYFAMGGKPLSKPPEAKAAGN